MSKRSFSFSTENLLEEVPTLATGVYAATLIGCSVVGKENKQHIQVVAESVWKEKKRIYTGDYLIQGNIYYGVELTGSEAKQTLGRDEPRFYGGRININTVKFDPENPNTSWGLDSNKNTCLVKACKILNINIDELMDSVEHKPINDEGEPTFDLETLKQTFSFTSDEEAVDPANDILSEDVLSHPDVEFMLNFVLFYRELFNLVAQMMDLQQVGINIEKRPNRNTKVPENVIALGNDFTPTSPGFIAYKEGMH